MNPCKHKLCRTSCQICTNWTGRMSVPTVLTGTVAIDVLADRKCDHKRVDWNE